MKKMALALTLAASTCFTIQASADDACQVSLCMWGYFNGKNDGTCKSSIAEYFNILVYKHGKIKWSQTADARLSQLQSCEDADPSDMKSVNSKFGTSRG